MIRIYGIPNCDIVKKAIVWFKEREIAYEFYNFKTEDISKAKLSEWINKVGLEVVVNKRSTTWRSLTPAIQAEMADIDKAIGIMQSETSIIKRPVIEKGKDLTIGFDEQVYQKKFLN